MISAPEKPADGKYHIASIESTELNLDPDSVRQTHHGDMENEVVSSSPPQVRDRVRVQQFFPISDGSSEFKC